MLRVFFERYLVAALVFEAFIDCRLARISVGIADQRRSGLLSGRTTFRLRAVGQILDGRVNWINGTLVRHWMVRWPAQSILRTAGDPVPTPIASQD